MKSYYRYGFYDSQFIQLFLNSRVKLTFNKCDSLSECGVWFCQLARVLSI